MRYRKISRRSMMQVGLGAAASSFFPPSQLTGATAGISAQSPDLAKDGQSSSEKRAIDYVNVLFGIASLDDGL